MMMAGKEDEDQLLSNDTEAEPENELPIESPPTPYTNEAGERDIQYRKLPVGIWLFEKLGILNFKPLLSHKALVLILTYICYANYHLSRKTFSVVKVVLCPECANCNVSNETNPGWAPFNNGTSSRNELLGAVDSSYLFSYAIAMFISGQIADRVNLRYFLFVGMTGSALSSTMLGVAYFADIHILWFFIVMQIFGGAMESTGWPGTVAVMSHWFGKHNRGLIMGVWNSHTSVGNILGTILPSFWANCDGVHDPWGWSYILPAAIMIAAALLILLMLVVNPRHVGLPPPRHHNEQIEDTIPPEPQGNGVYHPDPVIEDELDKKTAERVREQQNLLKNGSGPNSVQVSTRETTLHKKKSKAVNILRAFLIPGVIEYSLALFFNKLVFYTFLYWLPFYVKRTLSFLTGSQSDWLSTLFDIGGILGGILAGVVSDRLQARAITCVTMLILAIPSLFLLQAFGGEYLATFIIILIVCGVFVNGPYAIITTAVSSDLGTHKSLRNNQNAKATVTAIIDGTGSLGAAFGPLIIGWVTGHWDWTAAFYVLMCSCFISAVMLSRLLLSDIKSIYRRCKNRRCERYYCFFMRRRNLLETPDNVQLTCLTTHNNEIETETETET